MAKRNALFSPTPPFHVLHEPPPALRDSQFTGRQCRILLLTFHDLELLYPPAPIGLGNIDVAFGIDGQRVTMREITELMAGTAEGGEDLSAGMVEGVNLLVAAVHHVHEFLFLVSRETNPPCRTPWVRQSLGSCPDPDVPLKVSHL